MLLILRNYCVMIVVFLFIVTEEEGNCLYHIVSVLNYTISSFSFSRSKSFCWLVVILYMYLYCCVCRHFPPLSLLYFAVYFLSLSRTNAQRVRHTFAKASRLHRIRWSPAVCPHVFPPSPKLYTLLYFYWKSELTSGESSCSRPSSIGLNLGVLDNPQNYYYSYQTQTTTFGQHSLSTSRTRR